MSNEKSVLLLEPFYGGSHKQIMDLLLSEWSLSCHMCTMPATKWHWRARCSALHISEEIPENGKFKVIFASSVLNLAELVALRPDLALSTKIVYFHENQLVYPVQWWKERDFQYGYNQILTCLVADKVVFNSTYNLSSFLSSINGFLKFLPDYRPKEIADKIRPKCCVLYFPIDFASLQLLVSQLNEESNLAQKSEERIKLHIVWPHRWEHDKDPETFFSVLFQLAEEDNVTFSLSVLGQSFSDVPTIFQEARLRLSANIINWGFCSEKEQYLKILQDADVVVSTAKHEFYGVAVLEAVSFGCFALCPNRLVYPEIFPAKCLYNTASQLRKRLREFCQRPHLVRGQQLEVNLSRFDWSDLKMDFMHLLQLDACDHVWCCLLSTG